MFYYFTIIDSMKKIKNRGAVSNPHGRFAKETREDFQDGWDLDELNPEEENLPTLETTLLQDNAKSVITHNDSPDIGFEQSINPYRGCEHGCIYCYARPSHAYMGLSPGLDFETKIFYKVNAAKLLEAELNKSKYQCKTIVLGANTDPYQPVEGKLQVTRSLLEVLNKYNHPVAIITKSSMIERDLDLLTDMAQRQIAKVAVSITTLSSELKRTLEPRASDPRGRLRVVKKLTEAGIPVRVMVAPIIPLITCVELEKILKEASAAGARYAGYTLVRLPYEVKDLFKEWLAKHFPERAEHVMNIIRQMRGGKENDATFGRRMRGEGEFANLLASRYKIACKRFQLNIDPDPVLRTDLFKRPGQPEQLDLFG
jgi:DNA repair photolyase